MAHGTGQGGTLDYGAYHRYMRARGYARSTIRTRFSVAMSWEAWRSGAFDGASHVDVETWANRGNVTPAAVRGRLVDLRALYRWLMREGVVTADPTQLADRPRVPMRLPRPAPDADIVRLARAGDVQIRAFLALMSLAGLRCVECSRLDWRDVDLKAATVIVNGKGERERLVNISTDVVSALASLAVAMPGRRVGAVFVGPSGARMSPARVSQRIARAFAELGLDTRAHQLRHRCATTALAQPGTDLLEVRDLLGHASVATTQIYTAVVPERAALVSRSLMMPTAAA